MGAQKWTVLGPTLLFQNFPNPPCSAPTSSAAAVVCFRVCCPKVCLNSEGRKALLRVKLRKVCRKVAMFADDPVTSMGSSAVRCTLRASRYVVTGSGEVCACGLCGVVRRRDDGAAEKGSCRSSRGTSVPIHALTIGAAAGSTTIMKQFDKFPNESYSSPFSLDRLLHRPSSSLALH